MIFFLSSNINKKLLAELIARLRSTSSIHTTTTTIKPDLDIVKMNVVNTSINVNTSNNFAQPDNDDIEIFKRKRESVIMKKILHNNSSETVKTHPTVDEDIISETRRKINTAKIVRILHTTTTTLPPTLIITTASPSTTTSSISPERLPAPDKIVSASGSLVSVLIKELTKDKNNVLVLALQKQVRDCMAARMDLSELNNIMQLTINSSLEDNNKLMTQLNASKVCVCMCVIIL